MKVELSNGDVEVLKEFLFTPHSPFSQRKMCRVVNKMLGNIQEEYCINCFTKLTCIDEDPNGNKNCVCIKCRTKEKHDFDKEPNVKYNRHGERII